MEEPPQQEATSAPSDSCFGTEPLRMMYPVCQQGVPHPALQKHRGCQPEQQGRAQTRAGAQTPQSRAVVPQYTHPRRVWSSSSPLGSRESLAGTEDTLQAFPRGSPRVPPVQSTARQQRFPSNIPSVSRAVKFQLECTGKELPGDFSPWGAEGFLVFLKMTVIAKLLILPAALESTQGSAA